jgi:response regulator RpfG family c-di-GMP phosphodiesterase
MAELPRILCVDDEPQILQGLTLHLRRQFSVVTADSGAAALEVMSATGAPAVVLCDMTMPAMDGAALLKHVRRLYPETTRILLTGETSRTAAASAVNDGQVFRFLTKPCPPDELKSAVEAGVTHHHLMRAEKVLMQETLLGCINALIDVLAMTNPVAFGRTNRVRQLAIELASARGLKDFWQLEAAAMLSQIGYISLPPELVEKTYYGRPLSAAEEALVAGAPQVAHKLLQRIPRIEIVIQILAESRAAVTGGNVGDLPRLGADVLRLVLAYDALIVAGAVPDAALRTLADGARKEDLELIRQFGVTIGARAAQREVREVVLGRVIAGMVILDDLRTAVGTLLVPKGFEITDAFLERRRNFDAGILQKKVHVLADVATHRPDFAT